jgi:hypothetical protein
MKHAAMTVLALASLASLAAQAQPLRDPFARPAPPVPAVAAEPEAPQRAPQLRAVMVTPGRALANINGQILAVGEWFGDYQLTKVEERGVTLNKRGVKSVLVLNEASRK